MLNDNTKLLRVEDIAAMFQVKSYTIRYWVKKYKIPVIKVGKRIYLRPDTFSAFLDERTIESTDDHPTSTKLA